MVLISIMNLPRVHIICMNNSQLPFAIFGIFEGGIFNSIPVSRLINAQRESIGEKTTEDYKYKI